VRGWAFVFAVSWLWYGGDIARYLDAGLASASCRPLSATERATVYLMGPAPYAAVAIAKWMGLRVVLECPKLGPAKPRATVGEREA
jgi:hypothetical protein